MTVSIMIYAVEVVNSGQHRPLVAGHMQRLDASDFGDAERLAPAEKMLQRRP